MSASDSPDDLAPPASTRELCGSALFGGGVVAVLCGEAMEGARLEVRYRSGSVQRADASNDGLASGYVAQLLARAPAAGASVTVTGGTGTARLLVRAAGTWGQPYVLDVDDLPLGEPVTLRLGADAAGAIALDGAPSTARTRLWPGMLPSSGGFAYLGVRGRRATIFLAGAKARRWKLQAGVRGSERPRKVVNLGQRGIVGGYAAWEFRVPAGTLAVGGRAWLAGRRRAVGVGLAANEPIFEPADRPRRRKPREAGTTGLVAGAERMSRHADAAR